MQAPLVFLLHLLFGFLVVSFEFEKHGASPSAFIDSFLIITGYLFGLFASILLYRTSSFHRLHNFPGPKLAAMSKLWHVWQCRDSRNHELMEFLHEEYGDFVRIGMIKALNRWPRDSD